jgi:hypothetical protein
MNKLVHSPLEKHCQYSSMFAIGKGHVTNTLTYLTKGKSLITLRPGMNVIKFLSFSVILWTIKLECFPAASLNGLVTSILFTIKATKLSNRASATKEKSF